MPTNKNQLKLKLQYINDDIDEIKQEIKNCKLALVTYQTTLSQLESDKKSIQSQLDSKG